MDYKEEVYCTEEILDSRNYRIAFLASNGKVTITEVGWQNPVF